MLKNLLLVIFFLCATEISRIRNLPFDHYCSVIQITPPNSAIESTLTCRNFHAFNALNLSYFQLDDDLTFSYLEFIPASPIFFDNSLELKGLKVDDTYAVKLNNVYEFDLLTNPFAILDYRKKISLFFIDSVFEYVHERNTIDVEKCKYLLENEILVTILDSTNFLVLDNPKYSSNPMCPILFKGLKLKLILNSALMHAKSIEH